MSFACEDITQQSTSDWGNYEVVFLAALVGTDTHTKLTILSSLSTKLAPGTLVVARSAQGMRSVLYPVSTLSGSIKERAFADMWIDP
jgi:nicotianamine synthase